MSYDPYAAGSDLPPEYEPVEQPGAYSQARKRVQAPAIALIVVGILNVLWVGWTFFNVGMMTLTPANEFHQRMLDLYQSFPQMQAEVSKRPPDELKAQSLFIGWAWVALGLLSTMLTLAGGIRMLSLKNYALGIAGAICASLPCLTCGGCCLFGEIIGIWTLIVLMNPEVRAAFQG